MRPPGQPDRPPTPLMGPPSRARGLMAPDEEVTVTAGAFRATIVQMTWLVAIAVAGIVAVSIQIRYS